MPYLVEILDRVDVSTEIISERTATLLFGTAAIHFFNENSVIRPISKDA